MSIPVILGSLLVSLLKGGSGGADEVKTVAAISMTAAAAGFIAAAVSGFFALKLMLKLIRRANFKWFAVYLAALAVAALVINIV